MVLDVRLERSVVTWLRQVRLRLARALYGKHLHGASWQKGYQEGYQHGLRANPLH